MNSSIRGQSCFISRVIFLIELPALKMKNVFFFFFTNWEASCVLHLSDTLDLRGIRPRIWWHKTSWFYNRAKTSPPKETIRHCAAKQGLRTKLSPPSRKYNRRDTCSFDCRWCCSYSVISTTDGDYVYHVNYLFSDSNDKRVKQLAARRLHEQMTQSDRKSRQTF